MKETYCFAPPTIKSLEIRDRVERFPVGRLFCVGRNYQAHAAEMGVTVDKASAQPFYFNKHPSHILVSGGTMIYPPETANLHHEMELVVAIGAMGSAVSVDEASRLIFGYAAGLDMTRRDLQQRAKDRAHPWDLAKDFEQGAVLSPIVQRQGSKVLASGLIELSVNGDVRQRADLSMMIWGIAELISDLSRYYTLGPGDLIFTGTPEGVGPVVPGDHLIGTIAGIGRVETTIASTEAGRGFVG